MRWIPAAVFFVAAVGFSYLTAFTFDGRYAAAAFISMFVCVITYTVAEQVGPKR